MIDETVWDEGDDDGQPADGDGGEEGDVIGVEVANQTQCCGGLKKSAVCNLL